MLSLFSKSRKRIIVYSALFLLIISLIDPGLLGQKARAFDLFGFTPVKKSNYPVAPGVSHSSYTLKGKSNIEALNMLTVDPKNPFIKLAVTSAQGKVLAIDTVRNQAKQIDKTGYKVIAGVNSDFYKTAAPYTGQPIGLQISNREIITAPSTSKSVLGITDRGQAGISGQVKMTAKLQIPGTSGYKISGINRARNKDTQPNSIILFTSKFSTSTKSSGDEVEFVLNPEKDSVTANETLSATVEDILYKGDSKIPAGKWVLSASGTQADQLFYNLNIGQEVQFKINFSHGLDEAVQAVSGGDLIIEDEKITPEAEKDKYERHPRTLVAVKQGKLYITVIDGRQPCYSDGVTVAEGAQYLAKQGMEAAMNMDGGGSATYAMRLPGDQSLSIVNKPSDGFERRVSNGLMVVSTAPVSPLSKLTSTLGDSIKVLAKANVSLPLKGQDKYYNPVNVNGKSIKWTVPSLIGKMDASGRFTAGGNAAKGRITARIGTVTKSINVEVVKELASISLTPKNTIINPGSKQTFKAMGFDKQGNEIQLSQEILKWEAKGSIGKLDAKGTLSASTRIQAGKIAVSFGKVKTEITVNVGKPPVLVEDFEDIDDLYTSMAKATNVYAVPTNRPNPVKEGTHGASLSYDFSGTSGTSAAYLHFKGKNGTPGRMIDSRPAKLGMWVYGDSKSHWLRAALQDAKGKSFTIDFTGPGRLDWQGWKYVYAVLPANVTGPVKLMQIYIVETSSTNKNKGTIYFDTLRALY
ncbi:phosphodiester glycosidase family protein [Peribacillus deserti]|nr:phosphodiester glycosidase family protein [Peribacillus deserti]